MGESSDTRVDFIQEYTLKTLRLKPDKWSRMVVSDEQRTYINNFVEKGNHKNIDTYIFYKSHF